MKIWENLKICISAAPSLVDDRLKALQEQLLSLEKELAPAKDVRNSIEFKTSINYIESDIYSSIK